MRSPTAENGEADTRAAARVVTEGEIVEDMAEAAVFFAGFKTNALTGQSLIVSHGWSMQ